MNRGFVKKVLSFLLGVSLLFSLTSCGKGGKDGDDPDADSAAISADGTDGESNGESEKGEEETNGEDNGENVNGDENGEESENEEEEGDGSLPDLDNYVLMEIKDYGRIMMELDGEAAPETVKNFVKLIDSGFYDGLTFHRIMDGFMMQGGDPEGNGTGGSETTIKGEFSENGHENEISHVRGVVSMARAKDFDSASSQFFIVQQDSKFLDGQYAAFGHVTEGMEIVDAICAAAQPIDDNGFIAPDAQPVITSMKYIRIPHVVMNVKGYGKITLALDPGAAPKTVENFLSLVENKFYKNLTIHRVMQGFLIQGGDPEGNGTGGSEETIIGEFAANGIDNDISHVRGVISMARADDFNSASSQFFILQEDSVFLDGQYAAFGYVTEGMKVVDLICSSVRPIDENSNGLVAPEKQPVIKSITVKNSK